MTARHTAPTPQPAAAERPVPGAWAPLRIPVFRALWLALLAGNIGTWMHDVAASWLMAEQGSPLMVATVQAATTLPVVVLALVAGTLADIVDRRRYLIGCQLWMVATAGTMAALASADHLSPMPLLVLTFVQGIGAAMAMPAQAATTAELVPRALLASAVALSSISMNIARSIGPALGGAIVAAHGPALAFTANALSFLAVAFVLWRWHRTTEPTALPPERFAGALRAGLRYAMQAPAFQAVLWKAIGFFLFASAMPALLPILVRQDLHAGAGTYGVLLGCVGAGALLGALLMPRLRKGMDRDRMVLYAIIGNALAMVALALASHVSWLYPVMVLNGFTWITVLSALQIAAQTAVPAWVRARALSLYIMTFSLGMAVGSLGWGAVAQQFDTPTALLAAAVATVLAAFGTLRFRLSPIEGMDLQPSRHWAAPALGAGDGGDRGPVLVTIEYAVALGDRVRFLAAMHALGPSRRRDGAMQWGVMEDTEVPGTYQEYFVVASWLEHLRQHDRVTGQDRTLQDAVRATLAPGSVPRIRHFLGGAPR